MSYAYAINKTTAYMRERLGRETNGRDWWHVHRVWQMARTIGQQERGADMLVVELAALLHDLAHWQLTDGDETHGPYEVARFLAELGVAEAAVKQVLQIIRDTKYKGAQRRPELASIESKIVYDADKLDSLGAMGIAKTFSYGGAHGRPVHDPAVKPTLHETFEAYQQGDTTSINHFYEKNLLLKDWMQTETGRKLAVHRHAFLEAYLEEFYAEWEGRL
jgi:uncharacterized protein